MILPRIRSIRIELPKRVPAHWMAWGAEAGVMHLAVFHSMSDGYGEL